jgi:hypothetical protein
MRRHLRGASRLRRFRLSTPGRHPLRDLLGRRRLLTLAVVAMLGAAVAVAFWTAHGSGTATGGIGSLSAPTISSAKGGQETAELTWTKVTPPGSSEVRYYVSRDGGAPSSGCPSSTSPTTATSCTDTGVSPGSHEYAVTAVWRSWTARSVAKTVSVLSNPAVTSTSPSSRGQGASKQTITINGKNFISGATSSFGVGITVESTSFVSSTELTAKVSIASGAATGTRNVTVTNPDGGSGTGAGAFTVNAGPTVESTNPSSRGQRASSQNIAIKGTNFVSGATATFSGTGITVNSTSFVSSTELTANITVESGATIGKRNLTVTNPDEGVGTGKEVFTVNAGPTVESTSPSSRGQGASSQNIAIKGTNFVSGAAATFSGTGITVNSTSFVSSTEVTANITVESGATVGKRNVTVTNLDAGVGTLANGFEVTAKPTVTSTSPSSRGQGATSQTIKITGSGFVNGGSLAASFSGTGITVNSTSFVSSTEVTANITVESGASTGKRSVTVTNGDAGVGTGTEIFTVNAGPTVESTSPSSRGQGASKQSVTIKGTNFVSGAAATFSGTGITVESTSFVSATELTAKISVESGATTGKRTVTVTNPDEGVGTLANGFEVTAKPTVTSTSPSSRGQGASSQTIKITGSGFVNGGSLAASFSGTGITVNSTSFVSSTEVTANITIEGSAATTKRSVTVTNGDAGVGTSATEIFTVNAGPTVTSTTPSTGDQGGVENVAIKGTNFVNGATSSFGAGITVNSTTFVSSTELTAKVTIESGATTGARTVTVTNPDAGVGSLASGFTVNGAPTVASTSPNSRGQGATSQTIKITGTNFESGTGLAASFSGTGITVNSTTFVSSTEVTASITITSGATTGLRNVTVTNPDTTSATLNNGFTVNAGPTVSSPSEASPAEVPHNGQKEVPISGTGFVSGLTASLSNSSEFALVGGVTFTNSTSVSITVKSTGGNGKKTSFTLTNPDGGSVTCTNCVHD